MLFISLSRLKSATNSFFRRNKRVVIVEFSREFGGLKGLNPCFGAYFQFNFLENLKNRKVLLSKRVAG